jgi:hypothetical protein
MPEISRFFGIVIRMYFPDHTPPHFHARYGGAKARIAIAPPEPLDSSLPPRVLAMVLEWASLHERELLDNWRRLHTGEQVQRIAPLE